MPTNILNLPAYTITNIEETEHDYHINAETKIAPLACPHCGRDNFVGFGRNVYVGAIQGRSASRHAPGRHRD